MIASKAVAAAVLAVSVVSAEEPALNLHAKVTSAAGGALTIDLSRWSTDAERAPVLAAFAAPAPAPAAPAGAAGRAGRAGRAGGRGTAPPAALSPAARLGAAIKGAPTLGYIWGDGVTGYSIKYAWRSSDRVVLMTDRVLGEHAPQWTLATVAPGEAEYTLIEMHLDANGTGEGKTSLAARIALDDAAHTLALDGYSAAPAQLRITR